MPFSVGIAWPSLELAQTSLCPSTLRHSVGLMFSPQLLGIQVSSPTLLTSRLSEGAEARLFLIPSVNKGSGPGSITLKDIKDAHTIRLREIHSFAGTTSEQKRKPATAEEIENKRRQWLSLLLRETLGTCYRLTTCIPTHSV